MMDNRNTAMAWIQYDSIFFSHMKPDEQEHIYLYTK